MKKEKIKILKNNLILLKYYFQFAPEIFFWRIFAMVMILVSDISFNILFLKYVIDSMTQQVKYSVVLAYIAGLALVRIVCDFANNFFHQHIDPVARLKVHKGIYNLIYEKVEKVDLEKFDDADFYNDYIWALNEVDTRAKGTFNAVTDLLSCILNVLTYSVLSALYDKYVMIFVIIPVIANVTIGMYKANLTYKLVSELTPVNRKRNYARRGFYLRQFAKEIRATRIGEVLRSNFNECVDEDISITKRYRKKLFPASYCQTHVGWMFSKVLSAAYMSFRVLVSHAYTVGTFVVIYQAIGTFTNSLIAVFSFFPKLRENGLFAERLLKIIHYESEIEDTEGTVPVPDTIGTLELQDVSFRYPNSSGFSLQHVSMKIHKGEKAALVGLNGAGKTTLVKLILRFYDPTEGRILLNGTDIRNYNIREYRRLFATIFQDYQIFAVRLIENIYMRPVKEEDTEAAVGYMQDSTLNGFEKRCWDNVTKEFDKNGIVFSGGQSQKTAIARAFAQDGKFVIMDEASSALDPLAEAEVNTTVLEKMAGKSFVVISHRLSTIQNMDRIYVLSDGCVVEEGTHQELMQLNGTYAQMYTVQAEKYREVMGKS